VGEDVRIGGKSAIWLLGGINAPGDRINPLGPLHACCSPPDRCFHVQCPHETIVWIRHCSVYCAKRSVARYCHDKLSVRL